MGTILAIISTHAPAGGATQSRLPSPCWCRYFYSRPCGRGDSACIDGTKKVKAFLLTPLREGRLGISMFMTCMAYFYSRPCGRGD